MSTVNQIVDAIQVELEAMTPPTRVIDSLADTFTPPVALIAVDKVNPHLAFAGQQLVTLTVFLILPRASDRTAIEAMNDAMSIGVATSISDALEADQSLGGVAATCKVIEAGPPAAIKVDVVPYISVPFTVEVIASK